MPVEPPGPHVRRRQAAPSLSASDLRLGAAAGAASLVLLSTGDAFLLAVLLGVAALDVLAGGTVAAVGVVLLARWGSSSLTAAAGAQAVLGPGFLVGPRPAAAAITLAAVSLVLVAPAGLVAVAFGAAAGLVAAGPSAGSIGDAAVRALGLGAGAAAGWFLVPRLPAWRVPRWTGPVTAAAAILLAVLP